MPVWGFSGHDFPITPQPYPVTLPNTAVKKNQNKTPVSVTIVNAAKDPLIDDPCSIPLYPIGLQGLDTSQGWQSSQQTLSSQAHFSWVQLWSTTVGTRGETWCPMQVPTPSDNKKSISDPTSYCEGT